MSLTAIGEETIMHDEPGRSNGREVIPCDEPQKLLEMSELVRRFDWAKTPLGAAASWPDGLKATNLGPRNAPLWSPSAWETD